MTKAVLEAGDQGTAEQAVAAIPSPSVAVPASLHASLMARLDRLGSAKEVAQVGAVIGREFSHALQAAVASNPEAELQAALDGTLLREPRRMLHARIAETSYSQRRQCNRS